MHRFVRGATLSNYAEVAGQVGLDPQVMLRRFDIDRRALSDPDVTLSATKVVDLLEASAAEAACPTFGLRMAESRRLADMGAISLLIAHQATMREALTTIVQFRRLLNPALVVDVDDHGDIVVVREELLVSGRPEMRQAYELALGVLYRIFRAVLGGRWRARSVNLTHGPPPDLTVHRRLFGPICEFNSDFTGLTCGRADLDSPNPAADPALALHAERYVRTLPNAERLSLSQDVQKAVHLLMPVGQVSIVRIAESLGYNERTLQRRLADEGVDFTQLVNEVRRDLAARYVGNDQLAIGRVAGLVGFARQSSFNRWFAEAFGLAPTRWRASQRAASSGPHASARDFVAGER